MKAIIDRLAHGRPVLALGVRSSRTGEIARIAKATGHDMIWVDLEHSAMPLDAAAQMPSYYGTRIASAVWRKISDGPEVHVTQMSSAAPPPGETMPLHTKLIVARCGDGKYVRIGFFVTAPPDVA